MRKHARPRLELQLYTENLIRVDEVRHRLIGGDYRAAMARLRQILQSYADNYNKVGTHRLLAKDAPAFRPVQRAGNEYCVSRYSRWASPPLCADLWADYITNTFGYDFLKGQS
jgi:hypothetical protein